ncbi:MAG: SCP2 sterol-binding domain-containing protein [Alphaproteobacteria bacterium]|nr:SCP2 sterol-binding domain-containing protein [Alphaproteobacteria bacterium]
MLRTGRQTPALSPLLLVGLALRPAPKPALQAAATFAMAAMLRRHRSVFERLEGLANPVYLIDPVDLPVSLLLDAGLPAPRLTVLRDGDPVPAPPAAAIRGPLPALIELLEGRTDGDALFFSRALAVEGDMAAVVALRNAVDGADVDLTEDLLRPLGPLRGPARRLAAVAGALYRRADEDLDILRAALLAPVQRRCDSQDGRLDDLDETLSNAAKRRGRRPA